MPEYLLQLSSFKAHTAHLYFHCIQ